MEMAILPFPLSKSEKGENDDMMEVRVNCRFLSLLVLLCLLLAACTPSASPGERESTGGISEPTAQESVALTESEEVPTESADPPTESEEVPTESEEVPTESEKVPTESAEAPTESEKVPDESGEGDPETDLPPGMDSQGRYVYVEGTRRVAPYRDVAFWEDTEAKTITVTCTCSDKKHVFALDSVLPGATGFDPPCSSMQMEITGWDGDRVTEITCLVRNPYSYEVGKFNYYVYVIPNVGTLSKEIAFTHGGKDYVLPYVQSVIEDGFVKDIYGAKNLAYLDLSLTLCRQTSAFTVSLGADDVILYRPDEIRDTESLTAWATEFAMDTVKDFSPDGYEISELSYERLDFSLSIGDDVGVKNVALSFDMVVDGISTNEGLSVVMNTRGDIKAISCSIYGADWSTVPPRNGSSLNPDMQYLVTSWGILLHTVEWPSGGCEGIPWLWIP